MKVVGGLHLELVHSLTGAGHDSLFITGHNCLSFTTYKSV